MMQEFVQKVKDTANECIDGLHTAMPGTIVSVDAAAGLAVVQPTLKKVMPNGTRMDYPQISGVPIVFPQGASQAASIVFPVKTGDGCLLIISEESLEYWLYGMETGTTLRFDISNAICIPGLFQKAPGSLATACNSNSVVISGSVVILGSVSISGGITVSGQSKLNGGLTASGTVNLG